MYRKEKGRQLPRTISIQPANGHVLNTEDAKMNHPCLQEFSDQPLGKQRALQTAKGV